MRPNFCTGQFMDNSSIIVNGLQIEFAIFHCTRSVDLIVNSENYLHGIRLFFKKYKKHFYSYGTIQRTGQSLIK